MWTGLRSDKCFAARLLILQLFLIVCSGGCGWNTASLIGLQISPVNPQVRVGDSVQLVASSNSGPAPGGAWSLTDPAASITSSGLFQAKTNSSTPVLVQYELGGHTATTYVTILEGVPSVAKITPSVLTKLSNGVTVSGSGFTRQSQIVCAGSPLMTSYIDESHLSAVLTLPLGNLDHEVVTVHNPEPGGGDSNQVTLPIKLADLQISASATSIRAGASATLQAFIDGASVSGGTWSVSAPSAGQISPSGVFNASTPANTPYIVTYSLDGGTASLPISINNPVPVVASSQPSIITSLLPTLTIAGSGFVTGSAVLVNGQPVATTFIDSRHLGVSLTLQDTRQTALSLVVSNPDPGAVLSPPFTIPVALSPLQIATKSIPVGNFSLTAILNGLPQGAIVEVDGKALSNLAYSSNSVTGSGWLVPWRTGDVTVKVLSPDGSSELAETNVPVTPTAVTFDAASRFARQAGFGPRPDVVLHIQQIGFEAFLKEQFAAPINDLHPVTTGPIHGLYLAATTGSSLLRLRTAWALQTFMPGQTINEINPVVVPWEQTLERDAFSNYRTILRDTATDPNIGTRLTLPGNVASTDPNYHPNQNFGRELMQLFSLGMFMLNADGSVITDSSGTPVAAYSQDDVVTMSHVFTGWNYAPPLNPLFTSFGIDYSQPLQANDALHDSSAKMLFGTYPLGAGLSASADREAALDALMQHQSIAPFVARLLIQRFTTSQPSPAYVARISSVFRDNGSGVEGDMKSLITAILMDPEARAGDVGGGSLVGALQDPITSQIFMMSALEISGEDDQPTYVPKALGEGVFDPPTIFGYYSPSYIVPTTSLNSPEFELYNNFSALQRMQSIYGVVSMVAPGYNNGYQGWLYDNFHSPSEMLEAANHLLAGGTISPSEQAEILSYAATLPDTRSQIEAALFLVLVSDNYTVTQ